MQSKARPGADEPFFLKSEHSSWGSSVSVMAARVPAAGSSLLDAAWRFATDTRVGREFLDFYWRSRLTSDSPEERLTFEDHEQLVYLQAELEAELTAGLRSGRLIARGLLPGQPQPAQIHPIWWNRARIDLHLNRAQLDDTVMTDISITLAVQPPKLNAAQAKRREARYGDDDALLIPQIEALIAGGLAPFAAATQLAARAKGGGTTESKAKRLYSRFTQSRSSTQN